MVNGAGEIEYPKFGIIKVQGLTHFELEILLREKLKQYISDPFVRIVITRNWVTIHGEVTVPGLYPIENNFRYSILNALADAGGITSAGDKKRIKLIREENGQLEQTIIDLTTSDVFTSPYYYMKPNDIIVIDPNSTRRKDAQYGSADNYRLSVISTIVGSVSLLSSMLLSLYYARK
jgi:polysaccharide export outer membrane protein